MCAGSLPAPWGSEARRSSLDACAVTPVCALCGGANPSQMNRCAPNPTYAGACTCMYPSVAPESQRRGLLVRSFPGPTPASSMGSRWSPSADGGAPGGGSQARLLLQTACATRWPSRPPFASKRPEDKIAPKMTRRAPRSPPRAWAGSAPPARLIVNCGGFRPPCGRSGPAPTSNRTPGPTRGVGHDQTPLRSSALSLHPGRSSDHLLRRCAAEWGGGGAPHLSARSGPEMSHLRRCAAPRAVVLRRAEVRIKGRLPRLHSAP